MAQQPDIYLRAAMRLLDRAKKQGFVFTRIAPGADAPLWGERDSDEYRDTIVITDVDTGCEATRTRKSSIAVPEGVSLVTRRVSGDAITVLHTVTEDWAL